MKVVDRPFRTLLSVSPGKSVKWEPRQNHMGAHTDSAKMLPSCLSDRPLGWRIDVPVPDETELVKGRS